MTDTTHLHRVTGSSAAGPEDHSTDVELLERLQLRRIEQWDAATRAQGRLVDDVERTIAATSDLEFADRQEQLWWWREQTTELLRMTMLMLAELEESAE